MDREGSGALVEAECQGRFVDDRREVMCSRRAGRAPGAVGPPGEAGAWSSLSILDASCREIPHRPATSPMLRPSFSDTRKQATRMRWRAVSKLVSRSTRSSAEIGHPDLVHHLVEHIAPLDLATDSVERRLIAA